MSYKSAAVASSAKAWRLAADGGAGSDGQELILQHL
jgi:hypothetical protein